MTLPAADATRIAAALLAQRVGELLVGRGLDSVECNPVLVGAPGEGAIAVDAAIREAEND